jgi:hypothetical protein
MIPQAFLPGGLNMQRGHRYMELIICDSNWVFLVLTFPGKQLIFQTENIN